MHENCVNLPEYATIECSRLSCVERAWRSLSVDLHRLFLIVHWMAAVLFDPQANRIATIAKQQFQRDTDLRST
jgi:hypothetical protein